MKKTPPGIGLNLAFKLYILLVMMVGPTLLIYYIHNLKTINDLHEREVGDLILLLRNRTEDWIEMTQERAYTAEELGKHKENLQREMERIVVRYPGVESIAVFELSGTDLEGVAWAGPSVSSRPIRRDSALWLRWTASASSCIRRSSESPAASRSSTSNSLTPSPCSSWSTHSSAPVTRAWRSIRSRQLSTSPSSLAVAAIPTPILPGKCKCCA